MRVLSLYDGCSGARVALERLGVKDVEYFASEVDKYAIQIAQNNYPNTQQLGSVTDICGHYFGHIDLLIGGSPCQGFSNAGKKQNFDDPRSGLFWHFVRVLKEIQYKNSGVFFLLENVVMKQEWQDVISEALGVKPIKINSALVSAQNRERLYWTNIPFLGIPEDKGVLLKDIMHEKTSEYVKVSKRGRYKKKQNKASCFTAGAHSGGNHSDMDLIGIPKNRCYHIGEALGINGHDLLKRVYADYGKAPTVTTITGGNQYSKIAVDDFNWRRLSPVECERLQTLPDGYTEGVSNTQRYKMTGNGFTVDVIAHLLRGILIR